MYKILKEFKGIRLDHSLSELFNGKSVINLNTASQEELKHVYEVVGNHTHIEKSESLYDKHIEAGNKHFDTEDYGKAKISYEAALKDTPNDEHAGGRVVAIECIYDDIYNAAITKGDAHVKAKENKEAKAEYQKALNVKPGEKYPKEQIAKMK